MKIKLKNKTFEEKYKTQKAQVEYCLKQWPKLANCDACLTVKVWQLFYKKYLSKSKKYIRLKNIQWIPRQDNIRRIRARFNEQKLYMPTDIKVLKRRRRLETKWRKTMKPLK